ncbi:MAG: ABC transporter ATP-binding protein [Arachidicoccus sp.]|nr:ABC transporter ATP-binding protein [Arachidicoccus sp.]
MKKNIPDDKKLPQPKANIFKVLKPYKWLIAGLLIFALLSNALNLAVPQLVRKSIDDFGNKKFNMQHLLIDFSVIALIILLLTYLQSIVQTYASEKVARDLRMRLTDKISRQTYSFINEANPNKLLTNLTSDVDAVKNFVSQAIVNIISSIVLIIGTSVMLLRINVRLGLVVLCVIPIIGGTFFIVLKKIRIYFKKAQGILDKLNKIINEAILGSALIRILNAQMSEYNKFIESSGEAKNIGLSILRLFSMLIPVIVFTANMARLAVLGMGGNFVIKGSMTVGDFAAFNSYISILIFPIILIGFMSSVIARASASYGRIHYLLEAPDTQEGGNFKKELSGDIEVKNISLKHGEKEVLKNVSFKTNAGTRTAIIGPTAAGKTQLFYAMTTLSKFTAGEILYDNNPIQEYDQENLLRQIGLVFQDAIIFNMSLRENIAFNAEVTEEAMQKAIDTAELSDFISSLPEGLNTIVSEHGNNLSGGQKQRVMLARALACNPKILLLDEFTARVDRNTEQKIWKNVMHNYPGITVVSITQNLEPVKDYEQIILLMEGEIVGIGTHQFLLKTSPEYIQIFQSQQSVNKFEEV